MPRITYIAHDGSEVTVDVPVGETVMEGAINNAIPGIDADCGGVCSCATCHVYIEGEWVAILPAKTELEESMLEFAAEREDSSRLSCRLTVDERLDGLVVRMPPSQF